MSTSQPLNEWVKRVPIAQTVLELIIGPVWFKAD